MVELAVLAWQCLQIYGLYLVLVAVHEAGHLLAGALVGYRWNSWGVGPFQVYCDNGLVRARLTTKMIDGWAAFSYCSDDTRTRQAIFATGGPVASLLFGLILLSYFLHLTPAQQQAQWQVIAALVTSGLLLLASIIPYTYSNGIMNDAARLLWLCKEWSEWTRFEALTALADSAKSGRRPRDWDDNFIQRAVALRDGKTGEATAAHRAFYWAADRGDWAACGDYIYRALSLQETLSEPIRAMYLLNGAYYEGFVRRDGHAARSLMPDTAGIVTVDAMQAALLRSITLRAEAAILLADGQSDGAAEKAHEALTSLPPAAVGACAERCLIECLVVACSDPEHTLL